MKSSPDAIAIADVNGKLIDVSDSFLKLFGIDTNDKNSVIWKDGFELISPEAFSRAKIKLKELLKLGFLKSDEGSFLRYDGTSFHGELLLHVINDENSKPKYILAFIRDISHQKAADALFDQKYIQVKESDLKFSDLMNNIDMGITSLDKQGIFKLMNTVAAKNLGGAPESLNLERVFNMKKNLI